MSPFDPTIVSQISPDDLAAETLLSVDGLLKDRTIAFPYFNSMNDTCLSGEGCFSYILPGSFDEIIVKATSQNLALSLPADGTWFVGEEAPVYQFDYFPFQSDIYFAQSDCQIYASASNAVKVCLKNDGGNLVFGIHQILLKLIRRLDRMPCIYCGHLESWRLRLYSDPYNLGKRYKRYFSTSYFFIFRDGYLHIARWRNIFRLTIHSPDSGPI